MLRYLLFSENNDEETVIPLQKKLNLKDYSYMFTDIWNSLTLKNFQNVQNKLLGESNNDTSDSFNTLEVDLVDLNKMVDELFPQSLGFYECDEEDARASSKIMIWAFKF